jgi:hypothetical protein
MAIQFHYLTQLGLNKRLVGPSDIASAEQMLRVTLPQDLKDFLLAHDGPVPKPGWFPATTSNGTIWCGPVSHFLSTATPKQRRVGERTACLEINTLAHRHSERLPAHMVVVASLVTQPRLLLISTGRDDNGTVYAWRIGDVRFRPDQLIRVADSFKEFLNLLTVAPEPVAAEYRRFLANVLVEQLVGADSDPMAHLRYAQSLRNIQQQIDQPELVKMIEVELDEIGRLQTDGVKKTRLKALVDKVKTALNAVAAPRETASWRTWDYEGPEALSWLRGNANEAALAVNHFGSTPAAIEFVSQLYALGAEQVIVPETSIHDEDDMGPYADALVVFAPADQKLRSAVYARCEKELDEPGKLDPQETSPLFLWWD